jgi:hypothetical protein
MTVAEQLTKAVQLAKSNKLVNPRLRISYPDDTRKEYADEALPVGDSVALRSLEVTITQNDGTIKGVVGDGGDGRDNVVLPVQLRVD